MLAPPPAGSLSVSADHLGFGSVHFYYISVFTGSLGPSPGCCFRVSGGVAYSGFWYTFRAGNHGAGRMELNRYLGGVVSDVGTRDPAFCQLPRRLALVWSLFCSACL